MLLEKLIEQLAHRLVPPLKLGDSRRLFHGRGGCYEGLEFVTIDSFYPVLLITYFAAPPYDWEAELVPQLYPLMASCELSAIVLQRRYLPGAPSEVIAGRLPEACYARRGPLRFSVQLGEHQNTGFFLDMEPGRQWLERHAKGRRVLNLFAYTCGFSVVAMAAGSIGVVNVDMSSGALTRGRENHRLNQLPLSSVVFMQENILKSWGRIRRRGPYDVIIFDPPSYQPGSFIARKDYRKLIARLPELCTPGADILACLNAPELDTEFVDSLFAEAGSCEFIERLKPHEDFPDQEPARQLKLLHYCYASRPSESPS